MPGDWQRPGMQSPRRRGRGKPPCMAGPRHEVARRGSETAYGVLLVALVHEVGWERAGITGEFSLAVLVAGLLCPLAGRCLDRLDSRLPFGVGVEALGARPAATSRVTYLYLTMAVLFSLALAAARAGHAVGLSARWFIRRYVPTYRQPQLNAPAPRRAAPTSSRRCCCASMASRPPIRCWASPAA